MAKLDPGRLRLQTGELRAALQTGRGTRHDEKIMIRGWRGNNESSMNSQSMGGYFRIGFIAKAFPAALGMHLGTLLACLSGLVFTAPVFALVGPARQAPEFAPYAIMVLDNSGGAGSASFCTASVIAPDVVLTAAHCVSGLSAMRVFFRDSEGNRVFLIAAWMAWILASILFALLVIRFGRIRARIGFQAGLSLVLFGSALAYYFGSSVAARLVFFDVATIAIHPEYRPNTGHVLDSIDLALLRLTKPLPSGFKPVELTGTYRVEIGQPLRIVGFGHADENERGTSGVLRTGVLAVSGPKFPELVWLTDPEDSGLGGC
ncbi:trypsin-like serine protease, partial [candidate division KSB1 bacterium]|nr:trypsin-like serine protease [candidate division KSB1 bacterium]